MTLGLQIKFFFNPRAIFKSCPKAWAYLKENSLTLFYGEDAVQVNDNPFTFPKFKSGCILELKISNKLLSC